MVLGGLPETFNEYIALDPASAVHADFDIVMLKNICESAAGKLSTLVRVVYFESQSKIVYSIQSVPLIWSVAQMLKMGPQILQVGVSARYWADSPDAGPEDWGGRVYVTFLFPK